MPSAAHVSVQFPAVAPSSQQKPPTEPQLLSITSATHTSTWSSTASQGCVCKTQSAAAFAFVQAASNFSSHFVSFAASGASSFACAFEWTLALHEVFLPAALVIPASHLDTAANALDA